MNESFSSAGQTYSVPVVSVALDGTNPGVNSGGNDGEVILDIVAAIGMAPGLSQVRVYVGGVDVDIFNKMATENIAKQISVSWMEFDNSIEDDPIFQQMAAQGPSIFVASGDWGSVPNANSDALYFPAEDAYVTAVGGTELPAYVAPWSEVALGLGYSGTVAGAASGGGISPDGIPIPTWQVGVANSLNGAFTTMRNIPDVAAIAEPGMYLCSTSGCGSGPGTSLASPLWAGFMAVVNQQAVQTGRSAPKGGVGFINPAIYAIGANSAKYAADFYDMIDGTNGAFSAVKGYDLVTGWGSPNGQSLINDLAATKPTDLIGALVVDDTANAANWSIQSNLAVGDTQYGDRTFTLTTVPSTVAGSAWIRTANSSKAFTGAMIATFTVTGNADVYVAFNDLVAPKPSWLSAYTDSDMSFVNSEATPKTFELFKKSFATGSTVTLGDGGNTTDSFYTVVVAPTPSAPPSLVGDLVVDDTANAANWSVQSNLAVGDTQYGDRTFTLTTVPSTVAGSAWIRTANSSKAFAGATTASFTVTGNADVYVAFNDLVSPRPSWLSAYTDAGRTLVNSESPPKTFELFRESFATGSTVTLGNGGNTTDSFYTVLVAPTP